MDQGQKKELTRMAGSGVSFDCPMAGHTSFRVGGKAEAFYEAQNMESLRQVVAFLNRECVPYLTVGRGSNLLVKDEGLEGVVIHLCGELEVIEMENIDSLTIRAGGGLALFDLLAHCRDSGLGGMEFLAGIPGTVGGAIAMNAGAFGGEIGERVRRVQLVTRTGDLTVKDASQLRFRYRGLELEKGTVIAGAFFALDQADESTSKAKMADYLKRRKKSQPLEYPSAGSVFKNPPGHYAAKLIEQAGLKGARTGGAMISPKHANYILNMGGATARDVLDLINLATSRVKERTGIEMQLELKVVGR